jgi:hypothetical protein
MADPSITSNPLTSNPETPETQPAVDSTESFGDILSQYHQEPFPQD